MYRAAQAHGGQSAELALHKGVHAAVAHHVEEETAVAVQSADNLHEHVDAFLWFEPSGKQDVLLAFNNSVKRFLRRRSHTIIYNRCSLVIFCRVVVAHGYRYGYV